MREQKRVRKINTDWITLQKKDIREKEGQIFSKRYLPENYWTIRYSVNIIQIRKHLNGMKQFNLIELDWKGFNLK